MGFFSKLKQKVKEKFRRKKPKPTPKPKKNRTPVKVGPITGPSKKFFQKRQSKFKPARPSTPPPTSGPRRAFLSRGGKSVDETTTTKKQPGLIRRTAETIKRRLTGPSPRERLEAKGIDVQGGPVLPIFGPSSAFRSATVAAKTTNVISKKAAVSRIGTTGKASTGLTVKDINSIKINTKQTKDVTSYIGKVVAKFGKPAAVAAAITGAVASVPFHLWFKQEGLGSINIVARDALMRGDLESYEEMAKLRDEINDPDLIKGLIGEIPYLNVVNDGLNYLKIAKASGAVMDKMAEDIKTQQETGETDDERWARIRQEEADQERELIDYYNEQRRQMIVFEQEAKRAARDEEAKFWAEERAKQARQEQEDREAQAAFWLDYRKQMYELSQDNRPSNLKFGLL